MTRAQRIRIRPSVALGLLTIAFALSGCFNPFSPRIAPGFGTSTPPPVPSSASGVLRLFEWCYNNKAIAEYRELFTDDYEFRFSPLDSAGAEYRGTKFTREDELISTTQLFLGGAADQPPANTIRLTLDKNFFVFPDRNYTQWDAKGRWHKSIRTQVALYIQTSDGNAIDVSGAANFYMVRGDSAVIPEELRLRGFGPDSNRWYIRRWDDETAQPELGAFAAGPAAGARLSAWQSATAPATGALPRDPTGSDADARFGAREGSPVLTGRSRIPRPSAFAAGQAAELVSWGFVKVYYLRPPASSASRGPSPPHTAGE